ncbi:MAG: aminomethyl-transferring glycine dehydrogenase [Chitinophagales bacterium]|nr:aminomethyl-transferring glycine dehydrogenase [Chitinophagales bacterium]
MSLNFADRHIGPFEQDLPEMLQAIGVKDLDELVAKAVPEHIRIDSQMGIGSEVNEYEYLRILREKAKGNKVFRSYIGLGYYGTITPSVIVRNIFENPGWYTQYTPYQAEISQGRLEALLNFQTMVSDLTGLPIANASLLDEATSAAEAMSMLYEVKNKRNRGDKVSKFFVADTVLPTTIDVVQGRAIPMEIDVEVGKVEDFKPSVEYFAVLLQYPDVHGEVNDYKALIQACQEQGVMVVMAADIMSLALLESPGSLGADVAVGSTQRFGVPVGFGGPHAAYFACKEEHVRLMPGRIIGVSVDKHGNHALRMALQTREQHIKREKASSNICTAQALLAIMAGMYAVYHGPKGVKGIAENIHQNTTALAQALNVIQGVKVKNKNFFDTITVEVEGGVEAIRKAALAKEINLNYIDDKTLSVSLDETVLYADVQDVVSVFGGAVDNVNTSTSLDKNLLRQDEILTHQVFNSYHSETEMMRYIKRLESKDLSLVYGMIPLGSCTMKLNAATELVPVSWPEFASIHPYVPKNQAKAYLDMIAELESMLAKTTGFDATSLQPNSGAQGEYAGLMVIRAYHHSRGDIHRNVVLIPSSAHGTNPASAAMAGMKIVIVKCDEAGNIDVEDLREKAIANKDNLSCIMITYPSTHGVYEDSIIEICGIIHENGGKVYMDGANMNAQVGLTSPGKIGADVCHLNLHKTFAIPHGGGGPGVGPICVKKDLAPFLPGNAVAKTGGEQAIHAISAAPHGSASILLISYAYIKMLGDAGLTQATIYSILNANYLKAKLKDAYPILFTRENGFVAHEFIADIRPFKKEYGIEATDIAKRLMDFGFHAPTLSFPVPNTLMIEPTESESKYELDRFVEAMLKIRQEMEDIIAGKTTQEDNPIVNAPHTAVEVIASEWNHTYSREEAAYPVEGLKNNKFWPAVARVDNSFGDRNLVCVCPPIEDYM